MWMILSCDELEWSTVIGQNWLFHIDEVTLTFFRPVFEPHSICYFTARLVPYRHRSLVIFTKLIWFDLTLSPPIPLRLYTLPYWCNPPFLIFDIRALWRWRLSAWAPECQKLKMVGYTSMALNPWNSSNLKQLASKGLRPMRWWRITRLRQLQGWNSSVVSDFQQVLFCASLMASSSESCNTSQYSNCLYAVRHKTMPLCFQL